MFVSNLCHFFCKWLTVGELDSDLNVALSIILAIELMRNQLTVELQAHLRAHLVAVIQLSVISQLSSADGVKKSKIFFLICEEA